MPRNRIRNADGRSGNGGARQGSAGKPYPNRTDLRAQKVDTGPSAEYGQGERLRRAQQAVPLPAAPASAPPLAGAIPAGAGAGAAPAPAGPPPDLYRASERPGEPMTQGLATGPGAGPEILGGRAAQTDPLAIQLRALYQRFPSQELADLIMDIG